MNSTATQLSVVVASVSGRCYLESCLAALGCQEGAVGTEIIVADRLGAEVGELVAGRHPEVRLLSFERSTSVAELRARAIRAATGAVVAIVADYCVPAPDWCLQVVGAHLRYRQLAIGGAVDRAVTEGLVDRAAFLCEYAAFTSPVVDGEVDDLPGPNVSYKRRLFDNAPELLVDGYWETVLHRELVRRGQTLRSEPKIQVQHRKRYRLQRFCRERYHFGRAFAAARNDRCSAARRAFHLLAAPLLPLLLTARAARKILRHHRFGSLLRMAPLVVLFTVAASVGEWMGYAFGPRRGAVELC